MRPLFLLSVLGIPVLATLVAAAEPTYQFHKTVDRGLTRGEGILAVTLDPDVYDATREGFPDIRLLDESGAEVSFLLEVWSRRITEKVRESCESELVSLREGGNHDLEIILALKEKAPFAEGMTVVSPLRDFEHRFRVEAADGGTGWSPLVESGVVFDYSRYMDVRNRDILLPRNRARRFRLLISRGLDELVSPLMGVVNDTRKGDPARQLEIRELLRRPFRFDRIELWRTVERESAIKPEKVPYQAAILGVDQDRKTKVTRILLGSRREPLTGIRLRTSSRNFSREVRIEVPIREALGEYWREVGRGSIHRFQLADFLDEHLLVQFPEQRSDTYRMVIEDIDSPPLEVASVDAEGRSYRLSFVASEAGRYRLVYGSADATPPRYDAAAVLASLGPGHQAVAVGLGLEVVDREGPRFRGLEDWLNSRALLLVAMALVIVVLAWVLLRAGKQISKLPGPEA